MSKENNNKDYAFLFRTLHQNSIMAIKSSSLMKLTGHVAFTGKTAYKPLSAKLKGKAHLGYPDVGGRIILKLFKINMT
jgi:hypothetical protein